MGKLICFKYSFIRRVSRKIINDAELKLNFLVVLSFVLVFGSSTRKVVEMSVTLTMNQSSCGLTQIWTRRENTSVQQPRVLLIRTI